jgi:hypothetical protein
MNVCDKIRLVVYRFHEKSLEIFLVNTGFDEEHWRIPFADIAKYPVEEAPDGTRYITLEAQDQPDGKVSLNYAIEGDWHDIPSIRKLVVEDVKLLSGKFDKIAGELETGSFHTIKEAFKKVMPNEYKVLHDLKDIILSRNMLKNI